MKNKIKMVSMCTLLLLCLSVYGCREKAKDVTSESAVASAGSGKEATVMNNGTEKANPAVAIEYCGG